MFEDIQENAQKPKEAVEASTIEWNPCVEHSRSKKHHDPMEFSFFPIQLSSALFAQCERGCFHDAAAFFTLTCVSMTREGNCDTASHTAANSEKELKGLPRL